MAISKDEATELNLIENTVFETIEKAIDKTLKERYVRGESVTFKVYSLYPGDLEYLSRERIKSALLKKYRALDWAVEEIGLLTEFRFS